MRLASPAARALWLLLLCDAVLLTGLLLLTTASARHSRSIVAPVRSFFRGTQEADSWRPMKVANDYLTTPHDDDVYDALLISHRVKFQYPVSSLLFVRGLSASALRVLSQAAVIATSIGVWLILCTATGGRRPTLERTDIAAAVAVLGLTITFYPVIVGYSLGQLQTWVTAIFTFVMVFWIRGQQGIAGALMGVVLLMKPLYWPLILWGALRKRAAFVFGAALTAIVGTLIAIAQFGLRDTLAYRKAVSFLGLHGEVFYPNQSINGFLNRLVGNGDSLHFDRFGFPPIRPVVIFGSIGAFLVLLVVALWRPRPAKAAGSIEDFSLIALVVTIASPIAWDHHYGIFLPMFAAVWSSIARAHPLGRWTWPALIASYVLISQWLMVMNQFAGTPLGFLQSYRLMGGVLFGALILLILRRLPLTLRADSRESRG